ncbi:MAG: hypothetical protein LBR25_06850 [Erysipelotrichaceae bacterium]|jgi:hypothetical protein|nr:hypothetical protein [Erysipelotrichaceae bacterium]
MATTKKVTAASSSTGDAVTSLITSAAKNGSLGTILNLVMSYFSSKENKSAAKSDPLMSMLGGLLGSNSGATSSSNGLGLDDLLNLFAHSTGASKSSDGFGLDDLIGAFTGSASTNSAQKSTGLDLGTLTSLLGGGSSSYSSSSGLDLGSLANTLLGGNAKTSSNSVNPLLNLFGINHSEQAVDLKATDPLFEALHKTLSNNKNLLTLVSKNVKK